jgi:hypothetical protein
MTELGRHFLRGGIAVFLLVVGFSGAIGRTDMGQATSAVIQADTTALDSKSNLADWLRSRPGKKLEPAQLGAESERQGRWCARSLAQIDLPQ